MSDPHGSDTSYDPRVGEGKKERASKGEAKKGKNRLYTFQSLFWAPSLIIPALNVPREASTVLVNYSFHNSSLVDV